MKQLELRKAFDIYYYSKLAEEIADGSYGIENMDEKYLVKVPKKMVSKYKTYFKNKGNKTLKVKK